MVWVSILEVTAPETFNKHLLQGGAVVKTVILEEQGSRFESPGLSLCNPHVHGF